VSEKVNQGAVLPFVGDGQHALDMAGEIGLFKGGVLEEGADGGQAKVATAGAIVSMFLQLIEKGSDERGIEILQHELAGQFFQLRLCE
jgi:hypothetical protein